MAIFPRPNTSIGPTSSIAGSSCFCPQVAGRRVFLKPNIVEYESGTAINTDLLMVVGAAF